MHTQHTQVSNCDDSEPLQKNLKLIISEVSLPQSKRHHAKRDKFYSLYVLGAKLGDGGCGEVYMGRRICDRLQVAIKIVKKTKTVWYFKSLLPDMSKHVPMEVILHKLVSRPPVCNNIVQLLEWFDEPDCFIMIMELPEDSEDVYRYMQSNDFLLEEQVARCVMIQAILAAHHCNQRGVLHRDIKVENLLINRETFEVKLIDFGCGDLLKDSSYSEFRGTDTPPEYILRGRYHAEPATVWSLGVLLFIMVCGYAPFANNQEVVDGALEFKPGLSKECCSLLSLCLQRNPNKRPTLHEMSCHAWFFP